MDRARHEFAIQYTKSGAIWRPLVRLRAPYTLVEQQWVYAHGLPIALIDRITRRIYPLQRGVTVAHILAVLKDAPTYNH
jgi:hypothetical protein